MIANLPLLFANANPVALTNFAAAELEKFITFMVTCSWGHDTARDFAQPPWWPRDVPFSHPFVRPNVVPKDWEARLKNVVKKCYEFHKSSFLLVFSAQLSRYPRSKLRYVDNRDHTTSLYHKPNGRLLVTFRNENLYYDAKPILLDEDEEETQIKAIVDDEGEPQVNTVTEEPQVKSDIYLCDNCDSHFDNLEVLKAHERLCNNEQVPTSTCTGGLSDLLTALKLLPVGAQKEDPVSVDIDSETKPKIVRNAANIDRGPPYPFSSLAYMRNVKSLVQRDTTYSRERVERYCCTAPLPSKILVNKNKNQQFPVRYRRPIDYWHRKHVFPNQRNKKILDVKGQLLLFKCRPITVDVQRMSNDSMQEYIDMLKKEAERKAQLMPDKDIEFVDGVNCEPADVEMKSLDPLKRADSECEVIDLCSDDETPSVNENCDPRAGVACVMRGGAVLRRTAATPHALPSEPCGARQRPLPTAILQPHPVILIAHTLNNLQTISLE